MNRIALVSFLAAMGLLILLAAGAFGESLTLRPPGYIPVDSVTISCIGINTNTRVFRFGTGSDVRWIEIFVETTPGHMQLVAVAAYDPGEDGVMTFAEVLMPSGQVLRFKSRDALQASPYSQVCAITSLWMNQA